jgi:hypothetical protein
MLSKLSKLSEEYNVWCLLVRYNLNGADIPQVVVLLTNQVQC